MLAKLLLLFTIVPILETYLLVLLGNHLGFWPTVAIVLVTGVLGATLGKREGLKVWRAWQSALAQGRMPEEGILGGVLVLIGGVLLVTPGVLTDITGIALLVPPSRRFVAKHVRARLEKRLGIPQVRATRVRVDAQGRTVVEEMRTRGDVIDAVGEVVEERRPADDAARKNVLDEGS